MSSAWYNFLGNNAVAEDAASAEKGVREKYPLLLHANETVELAFTGRGGFGRDKSYFTSHRILVKDGKGVGNKRKNYLTIPYASIQAFSVETAGMLFDGDMDVTIYSSGKPRIKLDFAAGRQAVDLFGIQQYLNTKINWTNDNKTAQEDYVHGEPCHLASKQRSAFGTFVDWVGDNASQLSPPEVQQHFTTVAPVLMQNEMVRLAFKAGRDFTIFTDLRLLSVDVQGPFGKKVQFLSVPWRSFSGFCVETAGAYFDRDSEMNLYTNMEQFGKIKQDFRNGRADILAIQKFVANKILGEDNAPLSNIDFKQGHVDPKTSWWFRDNQRPLDAAEMDRYYHTTVPLLQGAEHVEMAFKGRYVPVRCCPLPFAVTSLFDNELSL
jgi:hypothetical protein